MRQLLTFLLLLVWSFTYSQNQILYFEKNSAELTPLNYGAINKIAKSLIEEGNLNEIAIIGHTDADASDKYNDELALKRARAVRNHLLTKGIFNKITMLSKGEKSALNDNATDAEKQLNRRVEIFIDYEANKPSGNHFHREYDEETQVFTIDQRYGGEIVTKHGIVVTIEPRSFKTKLFATPIDIHIREYVNQNHFVRGNLTTTTNKGEIIESRGMIHIEAIQKNSSLDLEKGKTIDVYFPDRKVNDGTILFLANRTSQKQDVLWRASERTITTTSISNSIREGKQSGGETNWYGEGAFVRRTRWHLIQKGDDVYKVSRTEIKSVITMDTVLLTPKEVVTILTFQSPQLGWINCDRFYRDTAEKVELYVQYEADSETEFYLIFDDINSVLPYSYRENNRLIYSNVPEGKNVTIVAILKKENEEMVQFSSKKMVTKKEMNTNLAFEEITREELEGRLFSLHQ